MFIGAVKIIKKNKIELLQDFYYWNRLGYSVKESKLFALKKFAYYPNTYDTYSNELDKLVNKNQDLIEKLIKQDNNVLNASLIKL
jgi:hypothetical protein